MNLSEIMQRAFRDNQEAAKTLIKLIKKDVMELVRLSDEPIKIMTFCGTHEWTITYHGLRYLLPPEVELIAGPGCPVCVTPATYVEELVKLAMDGVIVYTYGDGYRLPTSKVGGGRIRSLQDARALGADIRVVYSFLDAVRDAKKHNRDAVFFGIGFETITPSYSGLFKEMRVPRNLSFLSAVKLTPPAMKYVIKLYKERGILPLSGVIAPGHVSAIIGAKEWMFLPTQFGLPTVIAGFEPIDILYAIAKLIRMKREKKPGVINEYRRLVRWEGNIVAKNVNNTVFQEFMSGWRGIGFIPRSGYRLKEPVAKLFDAVEVFGLREARPEDYVLTQASDDPIRRDIPPGCRCGEVVLGIAKPTDCPLFMRSCTPNKPFGPCMVSAEGTCRVWAMYNRPHIFVSNDAR